MTGRSPCLWTQLPQTGPSPCDRHKHACCTHGGDVYVLGGRENNFLRDFWRYSVVRNEWTELDCSGEAAPEELEEHSMVAHQGFFYIFGGMLDSAYTEWRCPLWMFDIAKQKWAHWQGKRSPPQGPSNRKGHSAVMFGSGMFIYGGYVDIRGSSQEFWSLNLDTMDWSQLDHGRQASLGPGPRHSHSAVAHLDGMYLFGGLRGLREQKDLWRWNFTSRSWSCLKATSGPSRLVGHSATAYGDSMLLFGGGESLNSPQNCLWRYSFSTHAWERLAALPNSNPPPRIHHCCAGLGPSYLLSTEGSHSGSRRSSSSGLKPSLLDGKFKPFKNKCFPTDALGTEGAIELETFSPDKGKSFKELGADNRNGGSTGKDAHQIRNYCLTFENQAFSRQWSCEDKLAESEEESIAHHLPDLLLVLGGKPLVGHTAISVWQMTLTDS